MIHINSQLAIDEQELHFRFVRASGPGGQNVNKVSSAVQLRFNVAKSPSLPEAVRQRACQLAGQRLTNDGELIIVARQFRTQDRNRQDAIARLIALIRAACVVQRPRQATKPSRAVQRRRVKAKRLRGELKSQRGMARRQPRDE